MSTTTCIYQAPKDTQPTSKLLTMAELMLDVLSKVPKDAKICVFQNYEGDGGDYYVEHIEYDSKRNLVTFFTDEESDSNNVDAVEKGAPWHGGDSDSDSDDE